MPRAEREYCASGRVAWPSAASGVRSKRPGHSVTERSPHNRSRTASRSPAIVMRGSHRNSCWWSARLVVWSRGGNCPYQTTRHQVTRHSSRYDERGNARSFARCPTERVELSRYNDSLLLDSYTEQDRHDRCDSIRQLGERRGVGTSWSWRFPAIRIVDTLAICADFAERTLCSLSVTCVSDK